MTIADSDGAGNGAGGAPQAAEGAGQPDPAAVTASSRPNIATTVLRQQQAPEAPPAPAGEAPADPFAKPPLVPPGDGAVAPAPAEGALAPAPGAVPVPGAPAAPDAAAGAPAVPGAPVAGAPAALDAQVEMKRGKSTGRRKTTRKMPSEPVWIGNHSIDDWRIIWVAAVPFIIFTGLALAAWFTSAMHRFEPAMTILASVSLVLPIIELFGFRHRLVIGTGWMARGAGRRWKILWLSELTNIRLKSQPKLGYGDMRTRLLFEDAHPIGFEVSAAELYDGANEALRGQLPKKLHVDNHARYVMTLAWTELAASPALGGAGFAPQPRGGHGGGGGGGGGSSSNMPKAPKPAARPRAPKAPKAPTAPKAPRL
jgi:hypothetical protein